MTTPSYGYDLQSGETLAMNICTHSPQEQRLREGCHSSNGKNNMNSLQNVSAAEPCEDKSDLHNSHAVVPDCNYEFHVGGSIAADAPCYVERAADEKLYRTIKAGKFAYVFNCRQMGKSSLRVRVENRLKKEGTHCAAIDLSALGTSQVSSAQWYRTLIGELNRCLNLLSPQEVDEWLEKQVEVTPVYRLQRFVEDVVLTRISDKPIVMFIDEIDSVLSLSFPSSDFFAWIRACYNRQVDNATYKRLTFVLLGVTTPSQLVRDTSRTPFNVGRAIELTPLSLERATGLGDGLSGWVANSQKVLKEIFNWTGGQPYLTQKLCALIQEIASEVDDLPWIKNGQEVQMVTELVNHYLIQNWELKDEQAHFKTIRERLLKQEHLASQLLSTYEQILIQGRLPKQNRHIHVELRLSGLVISQNGYLRVFNPIYAQVFDQVWVKNKLDSLRPYAEKVNAWQDSGCTDTLQLLRGQLLKDALSWAEERSLNDLDHRFLAASQTQEIQDALEIKEQERQILSSANQKAKRTLRRGLVGLLLSLSASTALISVAWKAFATAKFAERNIGMEQKGMDIVQNFQCCRGGGAEKNLFLAMIEGQKLYDIIGENKVLQESSTTMPMLALQKVLDGMPISSHTVSIHDLAFHPQKDIFVTARYDGTIEVWNSLGKKLVEKEAHEGAIKEIVFSANGRKLATLGREDETAIIWEFSDSALTEIGRVERIGSSVRDLVFVDNKDQIVTLDWGETIRLWDLSSENLLDEKSISQEGEWARTAFSEDGKRLVTVGMDETTVRLWDFDNNLVQEVEEWEADRSITYRVIFSKDGKKLATLGWENTVRTWSLAEEGVRKTSEWQAARLDVTSMSFTPDGKYLATLGVEEFGGKSQVRFWDLSGEEPVELNKWEVNRPCRNLQISPNGQYILISGWGDSVQLRDREGNEITEIKDEFGSFTNANFTTTGNKVVTGGINGNLTIWNFDGSSQKIRRGYTDEARKIYLRDSTGLVDIIRFSHNWNYFSSLEDGGKVRTWDSNGDFQAELQDEADEIEDVDMSHFGLHIVTYGKQGTVTLWQTHSGRKIQRFNAEYGLDYLTDFSTDGQYLAVLKTASETFKLASSNSDSAQKMEASLQIWDLNDETLMLTLDDVSEGISRIKFSQDNQYIATLSRQGIVKIWDLQTNAFNEIEMPTSFRIEDFEFSKDNQNLLLVGEKGTVHILNIINNHLESWEEISDRTDEDFYYTSLSPTGDKIAIAGDDGNVYILNWQGVIETTLTGHSDDGVVDVVFSGDGETINTLDTLYGGYAKVWSTSGNRIAEFRNVSSLSQDGQRVATSVDGTVHIKTIKDLKELLDQGCVALEDYFVMHPDKKDDLEVCLSQTPPAKPVAW